MQFEWLPQMTRVVAVRARLVLCHLSNKSLVVFAAVSGAVGKPLHTPTIVSKSLLSVDTHSPDGLVKTCPGGGCPRSTIHRQLGGASVIGSTSCTAHLGLSSGSRQASSFHQCMEWPRSTNWSRSVSTALGISLSPGPDAVLVVTSCPMPLPVLPWSPWLS